MQWIFRAFRRLRSIAWRLVSKGYIAALYAFGKIPKPRHTGKAVYLTFDDGPVPATVALLDTLQKYGAKATFFVNGDKAPQLIARMAKEGHTVANHSFSHRYREIYASEEAFFADVGKMDSIIREQTGTAPWLLRFPGGSSNTASSFNPGIMTRLTAAVTERGLGYADWNVDSEDKRPVTSCRIYRNVICGIRSTEAPVILQHMDTPNSVAAVERILIWGYRNGCYFAPLQPGDPLPHHEVNN